MATIRVEKNKNYTVMSNYHLQDKQLSLKAKGMLSVILSLPEDWNYTLDGLISLCSEGITAVKSALEELKEKGYMQVIKHMPSKENGGRIEYEYIIYEQKQDIGSQAVENLSLESLYVETPQQQNTNNKKEKDIINNISKENSQNGQLKRKRFIKPTVEEVAAYIKEKNYHFTAEEFIDYYETVGWIVGGTRKPMVDWKRACSTWERNRRNRTSPQPTQANFEQRQYTDDYYSKTIVDVSSLDEDDV